MPPEQASAISRVKGAKQAGIRTGQWLTREQTENLLSLPDPTTLRGARSRALLSVLVGCGLRRKEAAMLSHEHIQLRDARWAIVDLIGKGGRVRTIPMPSWAKQAIDAWIAASGISSGPIFRRIGKGSRLIGGSMSSRSIFEMVRGTDAMIGVPNLAPHDLRRTFAKLAHKGKAALEQIQLSLGHASVTTTERYLGVRQDLTDAPCDHLGISLETFYDENPSIEGESSRTPTGSGLTGTGDGVEEGGTSWRKIAKTLGIGTATAMRLFTSINGGRPNVEVENLKISQPSSCFQSLVRVNNPPK